LTSDLRDSLLLFSSHVCYTVIIFSIMSIVFNTFFFTTYIMLVIEIKSINQSINQFLKVKGCILF